MEPLRTFLCGRQPAEPIFRATGERLSYCCN